jgi:ABC-type phosphate transport system substrate-binding protein
VIDRATLAAIWAGEITMWNDQAIVQQNLGLEPKLPAQPIVLGYNREANAVSATEVLKRALEGFSEGFRSALAAANRTWSLMPPALNGTAVLAGETSQARLAWLKVCVSCVVSFGVSCSVSDWALRDRRRKTMGSRLPTTGRR